MIGQTISHYKILEKLGEGGMGVVYKAHDIKLDRPVALKFLPASVVASQDEITRLRQEARALSALNHPHIATVYDFEEADEYRFIALEFLPGGTLKSEITQLHSLGQELNIARIKEKALQIAQGLAHAHNEGIIHRDVKTDNIMLTKEGRAKITDFGLAKLRGSIVHTKTGSALGTVPYMSPEQIRGEEVDYRSDIFSFGIVLYEITTGRLPFRGDHEAAISYSIVNEAPIPVKTLRPDIPSSLESVIYRCLEKDKDKRFSTMDEVVGILQPVGEEGSAAKSRIVKPWKRIAAGGAALIVIGLVVYRLFTEPVSIATSGSTPSIAVLYAENISGSSELDAFSSGLTEEIITELSNLPGVQVVSRSDVVQFRGKPLDIQEAGKKLGVTLVMESSVRVEGNRVRVTCQVFQTEDRFHFWSQGFTRELTSTLDVQTDIAQQVALALKTKLSQRELEQKLGLPTHSLTK